MSRETLTVGRLREVLHYDRETGVFTWRVHKGSKAVRGQVAGAVEPAGYRQIRIDGTLHRAAKLAWAYVTGAFPASIVDHKSRNRGDDRFDNLRLATTPQNAFNSTRHADGAAGLKGVHRHVDGRWRAQIKRGPKRLHLGLFTTAEEAHAAYCAAASDSFGEFATAGLPISKEAE